ncbi:MAG: glycosyltransferase [Alishewanella aestuarii]
MDKLNALILAPHFLPGYKAGGVLRSLVNFVDLFSDTLSFDVITSDRDLGDKEPYYSTDPFERLDKNYTAFYCGGFVSYFSTLIKMLKKKHDFVFLNGLFNFRYSILFLLLYKFGFCKSKVYLFVRGELFESALVNKSFLKKNLLSIFRFLNLFDSVIFLVTDKNEFKVLEAFVGPKVSHIIFPDLPSFSFQESLLSCKLIKQVRSEELINLVFVGRIAEIKNIKFFISLLFNVKSKVFFEIYGVVDSLDYYNQCLLEVSKLPSNVTVLFKGACNYFDLPQVIYNADMLILPSFSENFGHVVAESLLLGVPVFVTKNSPWSDFLENQFGLVMDIDSDFSSTINDLKILIDNKLMKSTSLEDRIEFSKAAKRKMISFFKFDELKQNIF